MKRDIRRIVKVYFFNSGGILDGLKLSSTFFYYFRANYLFYYSKIYVAELSYGLSECILDN